MPLLFAAGLMGLGCAAGKVNRVEKGTASVERVHSRNIAVSRVYVYQDGDQLEIAGRVKRLRSTIANGGHVDIAIVSPEGELLEQVSTGYVPRIIRRRGSREALFTVRLPIIPPEGSRVRVAYHKIEKPGDGAIDCGDNTAVQGR
jgi:hypothetical protein